MAVTLVEGQVRSEPGETGCTGRGAGAPTRTVLADNYPLALEGIRSILADDPTIEVVALAQTTEEVVKQLHRCQPDLLILGIDLPEAEIIKLIGDVRDICPSCRVLVLGSNRQPRYLAEIMMAGAAGYLLKTICPHDLRKAIEQMKMGYSPLDPSVAAMIVSEVAAMRKNLKTNGCEIKERHVQILQLLASGASNREMAERLFLSGATVKRDMKHLFRLMKVTDRAQAVAKAYQLGIL